MIRALLTVLLSVQLVAAADAPKLPIQSAEQALLHFRETRETELLPTLTPDHRNHLIRVVRNSRNIWVSRFRPDDFKPPLRSSRLDDTNARPIFGALAAVEDCKTDTWLLHYSTGMDNFRVYIESVSGKVLYIYHIPEG